MQKQLSAILLSATIAASSGCSKPDEPARAPAPAAPKAAIGNWGFDTGGMDKSVKPGEDFYQYANGAWLKTNTIPPDLTSWGSFTKLDVDTEVQVHAILEELKAGAQSGTAEQKVHDF
jgi:putative endopeptidase